MTVKKIYFGALGISPDLVTGGLARVVDNSQNTFIDYNRIQVSAKKDRPSAYFPKKNNSYAVAILGDEAYQPVAAERLIRSLRYAKYLGIPIAIFSTAQINQQLLLKQIKLDQLNVNNLQRLPAQAELSDPSVVLNQLPVDGVTGRYIYNNDVEIYKELRQLRPMKMPVSHPKLSAKLLDSSPKNLDLILNQPTYWNLRLFANSLAEKMDQVQSPAAAIDSTDELDFIYEEATFLNDLFEELFSKKVMNKFNQLAQGKIESPQVILNLTTSFQEIYTDCLERIEALSSVTLSTPDIKKFAQRFNHKYQEVRDFIEKILADFKKQLRRIPLYPDVANHTPFHIKLELNNHRQELNDFLDWYDNYDPTSENNATGTNMVTGKPTVQTIYQFRADLVGAKPKIWRRFEVSGLRNMQELSKIIMVLFDMEGSHLYSLTNLIGDQERRESGANLSEEKLLQEIKEQHAKLLQSDDPQAIIAGLQKLIARLSGGNVSYAMPCDEGTESSTSFKDVQPGETLLQDSRAKEKTKFRFEYDFGDSWQVDLKTEKISSITYPEVAPTKVLKGKGDGIIEDIGGIDALMKYQAEMGLGDFDKDDYNEALYNEKL